MYRRGGDAAFPPPCAYTEEKLMRSKYIGVWILCLALSVCGLSACSLSGGKDISTEQNPPVQETGPATEGSLPTDKNDQEDVSGTEESSSAESSSAESSAETDLPEMEIPVDQGTGHADEGKDSGGQSEVRKPSGAGKTSGTSDPQSKSGETNDPKQMPETPAGSSDGTDPKTEPGKDQKTGIIVDSNGDIMLPEVP